MSQESRRPWAWLIFDVRQKAGARDTRDASGCSVVVWSTDQFSLESGVYRDAHHLGEGAWRLPEIAGIRGRSVDAAYVQAPNKTPEPTPTSVMPRADESRIE